MSSLFNETTEEAVIELIEFKGNNSPLNFDNIEEDSQDSSSQDCSICLGKFENKSYTDSCCHTFCFVCILEWSKVKSTCPLCKTAFKSIKHNVKSHTDYDRFYLPVAAPPVNGGHFILTLDRMLSREQDLFPTFFQRNPAYTSRLEPWLRRELGVLLNSQEEHLDFLCNLVLSLLKRLEIQSQEFHHQLRPFLFLKRLKIQSQEFHHQLRPFLRQRTAHFVHEFVSFARSLHAMKDYDRLAVYDFPSYIPPHLAPPSASIGADRGGGGSGRHSPLVLQPPRRRPAARPAPSATATLPDLGKARRRYVYRNGLRVKHISQDISPTFFQRNPACAFRLVPWLRRELGVLLNRQEEHLDFLLKLVFSSLKKLDIQSQEFQNQLHPFLHQCTAHFVHEFASFACSPHNMKAYDRLAVYDFPTYVPNLAPPSASIGADCGGGGGGRHSPLVVLSSDSDSGDDLQPPRRRPAPSATATQPDPAEGASTAEFLKPTSERPPKCILLSSDSEAEDGAAAAASWSAGKLRPAPPRRPLPHQYRLTISSESDNRSGSPGRRRERSRRDDSGSSRRRERSRSDGSRSNRRQWRSRGSSSSSSGSRSSRWQDRSRGGGDRAYSKRRREGSHRPHHSSSSERRRGPRDYGSKPSGKRKQKTRHVERRDSRRGASVRWPPTAAATAPSRESPRGSRSPSPWRSYPQRGYDAGPRGHDAAGPVHSHRYRHHRDGSQPYPMGRHQQWNRFDDGRQLFERALSEYEGRALRDPLREHGPPSSFHAYNDSDRQGNLVNGSLGEGSRVSDGDQRPQHLTAFDLLVQRETQRFLNI